MTNDSRIGVLLECAFEAAENAGIPLDKLAGTNTGVFSSQEEAEYGQQMIEDLPYVNCTIPRSFSHTHP